LYHSFLYCYSYSSTRCRCGLRYGPVSASYPHWWL
jgi:hypothetical protein